MVVEAEAEAEAEVEAEAEAEVDRYLEEEEYEIDQFMEGVQGEDPLLLEEKVHLVYIFQIRDLIVLVEEEEEE